MKCFFAAVGAFALAGNAYAADIAMPTKAPPPLAPPIYNWTGFYVGLNAGYSWGQTGVDYSQGTGIFGSPPNAGGVFAASYELDPGSFIGGGQVGYNFQSGSYVFGLEADVQGRHKSSSLANVFNAFQDRFVLTDTQDWFATFRGRLGYAINNWLFYATGGLAVGRVEHEVSQASNTPVVSRDLPASATRTGWTVGGGVEWGFAQNWSLAAEYLYIDLGSRTLNLPSANVAGLPGFFSATSVEFHDHSHIARAKLNYRF